MLTIYDYKCTPGQYPTIDVIDDAIHVAQKLDRNVQLTWPGKGRKYVDIYPGSRRSEVIERMHQESRKETISDLRAQVVQLTKERDDAVNCLYEVRNALSQGDPGAAMEEVITWKFNISKEMKSKD